MDEVIRMSEVGILHENERVELVDGILVTMSPEGLPHAEGIEALNGLLSAAYPYPDFGVRVQATHPLSTTHYWVIDLPRRAVVVHSDPSPDGYRRVQTLRASDRVPLPARDASLSVADILGPGEHTPAS